MSERAVIDLSKVGSKEDLHRLLKGMLLFPDHYGANLDALHDMLTERHRELILTNTADTSDELKDYLPRLLEYWRILRARTRDLPTALMKAICRQKTRILQPTIK